MKTWLNIKSIALLAMMALITLPAIGQGGPPPGGPGGRGGRQFTEEDVKNRVKRQSQTLGMNEEQEKKIMDFELEQYKKNQVEFQKNQGDWEKRREYMTQQREVRDQKYKEVLTEDQYKQYKQNQEERRQRMQENRPPGQRPEGAGTGDRPDRGRGRN